MKTIGVLALLVISFTLGAHYGKSVGIKLDTTIRGILR